MGALVQYEKNQALKQNLTIMDPSTNQNATMPNEKLKLTKTCGVSSAFAGAVVLTGGAGISLFAAKKIQHLTEQGIHHAIDLLTEQLNKNISTPIINAVIPVPSFQIPIEIDLNVTQLTVLYNHFYDELSQRLAAEFGLNITQNAVNFTLPAFNYTLRTLIQTPQHLTIPVSIGSFSISLLSILGDVTKELNPIAKEVGHYVFILTLAILFSYVMLFTEVISNKFLIFGQKPVAKEVEARRGNTLWP